MSRELALARGRELAEAGMVDACTITRQTITGTDPDTGAQTVNTVTVYTGKCEIQQHSPGAVRFTDAGEAHRLMQPVELKLPMSSTGFRPGDIVVIDSSVNDADLVGRRFRIRELARKSWATSRRLGIEEAT